VAGLLVVGAIASPLLAQAGRTTLTGIVKDIANGQPVPAATVSVYGTPYAASTNEQGRYTIPNVPTGGIYRIEVRRIGYGQIQKANVRIVGATMNLDLDLNSTALALEGISVSASADPTSALKSPFNVITLTSEQMPVAAMGAASAMIQGKVAGVTVIRPSGEPGAGTNVQLRAPLSPFRSNGPLWVVDNVPLSDNMFNGTLTMDIESMDIESIEVIKGAAAAAIYGSRAAGGVISIKTNRGKNVALGRSQITGNQQYGIDQIAKQVPKLEHHYYRVNDQKQWVDANNVLVPRGSRVIDTDGMIDNNYAVLYDNIHQVFKPAQNLVSQVSLAQSSAQTNLNISFNRNYQPGTNVVARPFTRQTFRATADHTFRDDLVIGVSAEHSRITRNSDQLSYTNLWRIDPDVDLLQKNNDGSAYRVFADSASTITNPLYLQQYRDNKQRRSRSIVNTNAQFRPYNWLQLVGDFGYDRQDRVTDNYTPPGLPTDNNGTISTGSLSYQEDEGDSYNASAGGTISRDFGLLALRFTSKGELQRERGLTFSASGTQFSISGLRDLGAATSKTNSSSTREIRTNAGWASLDGDYADRFGFSALFRHEGSSLFGPEHRYNDFYRIGARYTLTSESWWSSMPSVLRDFSNVKLRYNWGTAGTRPAFADQYPGVNISTSGLVRDDLGNPNLVPERKTEQEFGVDAIYKSRLSFVVNYSRATTRDNIVGIAVPSASGFNTAEVNVGKSRSETWEGTIEGAWISRKDFRWSTNLVLDKSREIQLEYNRPCYIDGARWRCDGIPLTTMWGRRIARGPGDLAVDAATQAVKDQFQVNDEGYLVWVGAGNTWKDGLAKSLWNTSTRINNVTYRWGEPFLAPLRDPTKDEIDLLGDGQPRLNIGIGNRFNYKGIQIYGLFWGKIGGDLYNNLKQNNMATSDWYEMDQTGKADTLKKPYYYYTRGVAQSNNFWMNNFLETGTFMKFKEAQIQYSFNQQKLRWISKLGAERMDVALIGRDLYTWTKFKGLDPESGAPDQAIADPSYPIARNFSMSFTFVF
jgi:TonB-linked SusC/RagA family outer membrane protein